MQTSWSLMLMLLILARQPFQLTIASELMLGYISSHSIEIVLLAGVREDRLCIMHCGILLWAHCGDAAARLHQPVLVWYLCDHFVAKHSLILASFFKNLFPLNHSNATMVVFHEISPSNSAHAVTWASCFANEQNFNLSMRMSFVGGVLSNRSIHHPTSRRSATRQEHWYAVRTDQ